MTRFDNYIAAIEFYGKLHDEVVARDDIAAFCVMESWVPLVFIALHSVVAVVNLAFIFPA